MIDHASLQAWLNRYVAAWHSCDPAEIGNLFTPDATYRYHPADEPVTGRNAIVASWLDEPDEPGTFDAEYHPFAVDGPRAVATGWSRYFTDASRNEVRAVYDNCYAMEFAEDGRCSWFVEWFRERPQG